MGRLLKNIYSLNWSCFALCKPNPGELNNFNRYVILHQMSRLSYLIVVFAAPDFYVACH